MRITNDRCAEIAALVRTRLGKSEPTDAAEVEADLRAETLPQSVLIGVISDLIDGRNAMERPAYDPDFAERLENSSAVRSRS